MAQRNCSLPPTSCPPGWPHRGTCCHLEKALKGEFLRWKLASSGGCFCWAVPAFIHYHKKWRSSILPGSLTSADCSIWITASGVSFSDVSTLNSHPATAEFPPPCVLHRPILIPAWREKSSVQFSHQVMLSILICDEIIDRLTGGEMLDAEEVVF